MADIILGGHGENTHMHLELIYTDNITLCTIYVVADNTDEKMNDYTMRPCLCAPSEYVCCELENCSNSLKDTC